MSRSFDITALYWHGGLWKWGMLYSASTLHVLRLLHSIPLSHAHLQFFPTLHFQLQPSDHAVTILSLQRYLNV